MVLHILLSPCVLQMSCLVKRQRNGVSWQRTQPRGGDTEVTVSVWKRDGSFGNEMGAFVGRMRTAAARAGRCRRPVPTDSASRSGYLEPAVQAVAETLNVV